MATINTTQSEPIPPAAENTPNPNKLTGTSDDDSSYDKKTAADITANSSDGNVQEMPEMVVTSDRPKKPQPRNTVGVKPGRRSYNPLGNYASNTYQLSLYMITPDAYDAFVLSGRKNINVLANESTGGAYLVAQSGGVNNTSSKRAPGFELDYYIDDLKIVHAVTGQATQTESNVTTMKFNIYEPYGFSFISRLKKAADAIKEKSKLPDYRDLSNASKQFFVLGIRFQGYDTAGNVLTSSTAESTLNNDESANANGVHETYYDILITSMKFTLDGKMSTYKITAATLQPNVGLNSKRATLNSQRTIVARTVEEALNGTSTGVKSLIGFLNDEQEELKKLGRIKRKSVFSLKFIGPSENIKNALLVDKSPDKSRAAPPPIENTNQSDESASAQSTPNLTRTSISLGAGIPIMQAISEIIKQSDYLSKAINTLQNTKLDGSGDDLEEVDKNRKPKPFQWFNLSAVVKCLGWDPILADFAYDITYIVQPFLTPAAMSPYIDSTSQYYGPHKRYEYWYTGQNKEIISYEQVLNNNYYTVEMIPVKSEIAQGGGEDIAQSPNKPTNQSRTGTIGSGLETENSVLVNLFDPNAYVRAKVSILGDPDYLMQDSPGSVNEVYRAFYGDDGFTINPNSGQVFFEIHFKEARDYNNNNGVMSINDQILLWNYPESIATQVKGVSYKLISVESNFTKGKFVQELMATINSFPNAESNVENSTRETPTSSTGRADVRIPGQQAGSTTSSNENGTSTGSTGLVPDDATGVDAAIAQQQAAAIIADARASVLTTNQTSPTGGPVSKAVADDDATVNSSIQRVPNINNQDDGREIPENTLGNRGV